MKLAALAPRLRQLLLLWAAIRAVRALRAWSRAQHALVASGVASPRRTPPQSDPELFARWMQNAQGLWLWTREWRPATNPPRAAVLLLHGFGEHAGRYEHVGRALAARGVLVAALDHQGHGASEGCRVHVERWQHYVDDALQLARERLPADVPRFVLGHSMGGLLALDVALRAPEGLFQGVVSSGPALKADAPAALVAAGRVLSWLLPKVPTQALDSSQVVGHAAVRRLYESDPLCYRGAMKARWANELLGAMARVNRSAAQLRMPLALLVGADDKICLPQGSRDFFAAAASADKELKEFAGLRHEIFNEEEWRPVVEWVGGWLLARASSVSVAASVSASVPAGATAASPAPSPAPSPAKAKAKPGRQATLDEFGAFGRFANRADQLAAARAAGAGEEAEEAEETKA